MRSKQFLCSINAPFSLFSFCVCFWLVAILFLSQLNPSSASFSWKGRWLVRLYRDRLKMVQVGAFQDWFLQNLDFMHPANAKGYFSYDQIWSNRKEQKAKGRSLISFFFFFFTTKWIVFFYFFCSLVLCRRKWQTVCSSVRFRRLCAWTAILSGDVPLCSPPLCEPGCSSSHVLVAPSPQRRHKTSSTRGTRVLATVSPFFCVRYKVFIQTAHAHTHTHTHDALFRSDA